MSPFHLFPLARWFYKPATWVVAVILLAFIDLMTPPWVHVCVLALLLVTLAWNSLPRRFMPLLMATTLVAVSVPGLIRGIAASQNDGVTVVAGQLVPTPHSSSPMALGQLAVPFLAFGPARCWTLLALVGQWWFHRRLQQRRARRLALRRSLQQRVHRRTDQVKRANQALRGEIVRRQETQHQLDQSESTFEALIERMELQVSRKDSQGVITYANDIYCQKLGLDPTKVIGSTDEELFSPVIAEKYRNDDRTIMETGQVIDQIEQHPTPEGNAGFVQVFKAPEYDRDGNCIGIQVIFWDITQKHLGEIALRDSEARKRALFDSAGDAVVLLDQDDLVVEANPAAIDLFRDPLVGKTFAEIAEPFASAESNVDTDEESSGGRNERGPARVGRDLASNGRGAETWGAIDRETRHELNIRLRDGRRFDSEVSVHTIPVGDHDGVAVIIRDVTLQKRAMEALRDAKASAEAANRTKTEFMAGVSHELRTPLGGIIGLSDLLSQTPLNESGQEYVQMIGESAQALTDVIEDILDFAAIDAGRLDIDPRPMDLHRCVGGAFKSLAVRAAELPISLVFSMQPDTPRYVIADAKRVRQVMINLIGNAIKFTREGEVRVRLSVDPILETEPVEELDVPATDQHVFLVEVADTGVGIPPDKQQDVFTEFERGEIGTKRSFGGTGLGLSISDSLIRRMGGRIDLVSQVGVGSCFSCLIPLELADPGDHAWNSVDDNGFAARPVAGQEEHGEVAAPDRIEFSERHRAGPDGASRRESGRPHRRLAVVDAGSENENASIEETLEAIGMPVVRKTHFEERIGGTSRRNAIDSVVWVLAEPVSVDITTQIDARRDTVIRLHRVGQTFDERLAEREVTISQPVLPAELMNAVFHPRERKDTGKSATGPRASVRGKKLLLVDDSEVNRLVIGRQLASKGHVVTTANDGLQAVRMAEQNEYDAILMDVQMPEMDGIEATNRIRLRHRELDREPPPIIALTAHVTAEHERICKEAGMVGFVTKPVRFESLLRELEQLFPAKSPDGKGEKLRPENRTAPVQSPSSGDDRLVRPHSSAAKPPSPIVPPDDSIGPLESDIKQRLFKHCGGNSEIGISLCDAFLQEVPDLIARLRKNRTAPGSSELVRAAHTLKSCLKYVADDETVAAAAKLEADAKTDVVLDEERLDDLVKRSQNWMDRVRVLKEELAGS